MSIHILEVEADLLDALADEADLCRNESANDLADLLDKARAKIVALTKERDAAQAEALTFEVLSFSRLHLFRKANAAKRQARQDAGRLRKELKYIAQVLPEELPLLVEHIQKALAALDKSP